MCALVGVEQGSCQRVVCVCLFAKCVFVVCGVCLFVVFVALVAHPLTTLSMCLPAVVDDGARCVQDVSLPPSCFSLCVFVVCGWWWCCGAECVVFVLLLLCVCVIMCVVRVRGRLRCGESVSVCALVGV